MRALVSTGGKATVRDLPARSARGESVVRVKMSGICNTDLEIVRGYAGFQGTIGHEFVGTVEASEDGAPKGARVVGEINAGCGSCPLCAAGDPQHCAGRTVLGIVGRDGAHAEALRLPARNLLPVPEAISDRQAVFAEPLAAACAIVERVPLDASTRVAVVGDGKLGLLCAQVLAAKGMKSLVLGKHPSKLALVEARGVATCLVQDAAAKARAFDVAVDASGAKEGFEAALALLRPRGTLVLKSTFHGQTAIDATRIVVDEITIVGSRCGRLRDALELLERRAVDVEPLVTETFALADAERALARAAEPGVLKVLLRA